MFEADIDVERFMHIDTDFFGSLMTLTVTGRVWLVWLYYCLAK